MRRSSPENRAISSQWRSTVNGTVQVFLAESLLLPTGLITAAYLTRHLGPNDYGLFTLAASVVAFLSWVLPSAFGRASIQAVGEHEDWEPVASTLLRVFLIAGVLSTAALAVAAVPLANIFGEPVLVTYLLVFSIELALFSLVHAHRSILVGAGLFSARARITVVRWLTRMVLIVVLVELGLSISGAILGSVGATFVELVACRVFVRPRLNHPRRVSATRFLGRAAPLIAFGICMRLFDRVDLFALKALGATASTAGYYGAAQNLSIAPSLFALSFAPLLLSSLTRLRRAEGGETEAKTLARNALRLALVALPFAGVVVAAAPQITHTIFGSTFAPTAPILARLIVSSVAQMVVAVATVVVIVAGHPRWASWLALAMLVSVIAGLLFAIPRFGTLGAATVTAGVAVLGAVGAVGAAGIAWSVYPPLLSVARSGLVAGGAYVLASSWPAEGWMLPLMLLCVGGLIPVAFLSLGELSRPERQVLRAWLRPNPVGMAP